MNRFKQLCLHRAKPLIIGMVHVKALPGAPLHRLMMKDIINQAVAEANIYKKHKVDGVIIENMHDIPYVMSAAPETISAMSIVCHQVRHALPDMLLGVQILAAGNKEALSTALCAGLDFIRAESFVYSHVADEGIMNGCAGELLRHRSNLNAQHIAIITDIKKKHSSHTITADVSVEQMARDAEFFQSDGVVLTGCSTAEPADTNQLDGVKSAVSIPVLVGSGVTAENLPAYRSADALIVGSYFKSQGDWRNELEEKRLQALLRARDEL